MKDEGYYSLTCLFLASDSASCLDATSDESSHGPNPSFRLLRSRPKSSKVVTVSASVTPLSPSRTSFSVVCRPREKSFARGLAAASSS
jgi:hypothetical protein